MQPANAKAAYRPDIDGLRAVALILVLLFHAGFERFTGGFIGVDVFFVISGYLITQILYKSCFGQQFGYLGFLSKRFFRLYPALLVTLALTWAFGFLLLSPEHFKALGEYMASALFSISNVVFLWNTGYFAEAAGTNPLLHTWSLGVEQQFYLFWPLLIFLAFKVRKEAVPIAIALIGVASLVISQHLVGAAPSDSYFLVHSRVFEFAVGALIPWIERRRPGNGLVIDAILAAGLAILGYCTLTYTKHTPFPGFMALLPCVGAAMCIYAGQSRYAGLVLRNPLIVWIGVVSYSVYLVHWPIFTFYRYYRYGPLSFAEKIALFLVPFLVAYPMFKLVEEKFRHLRFRSLGRVTGAALTGLTTLVAGCSYYASQSGGAPWRLDERSVGRLAGGTYYQENFGGAGFFQETVLGDRTQKEVSAIVMGDSFAGHLTNGLHELFHRNHLKAISIWESGCLMSPQFATGRNGELDSACAKASARAMTLAKQYDVPIIYAQSWAGGYRTMSMGKNGKSVSFDNPASYHRFLADNILELARTAGKDRQIIVVGSTPGDGSTNGVNLKTCLNRPIFIPSDCQNYLVFNEAAGVAYAENTGLKEQLRGVPNVSFLDPYETFCANGLCRALVDDQVVYADEAHLSLAGSRLVANHFAGHILPLMLPKVP